MSDSACECEAVLLGRQHVQGSAIAESLESLVRLFSTRASPAPPAGSRKCRLSCSKDGIEFRPVRRQEDEGFESDDDAVSQTSLDSNASSSCVMGATGTVTSDSSGVSDNDDTDLSLTPTPTSTPISPQRPDFKPKKPSGVDYISREFYPFKDVAFCHTDTSFPKVLVIVIKKNSIINKDKVDSSTGLEAVVLQCKNVENLKNIWASYKEFSRRLKMDLQFRYPHRRKESPVDNSTTTLYRNVFNDLQKSVSSTAMTTTSPFFKTWITNVASKPHSIEKEVDIQLSESNKYNLLQRTDDDGVTHIEVSKAVDEEFANPVATDEYSGSSSIISISTPDIGNLFVPSSSTSTQNSFPLMKETPENPSEIEGVICADIETSHSGDETCYKSLENKVNVDNTTAETATNSANTPPQRPQRGKYIKKNAPKPKNIQQIEIKSKPSNAVLEEQLAPTSSRQEISKLPATHEKVVRGQFIRVNVEQQNHKSIEPIRIGNKLFSGEPDVTLCSSSQTLSYPLWNSSTGQRKYRRRSRSSSSGQCTPAPTTPHNTHSLSRLRSSSPPARTSHCQNKPLTSRFFGKLKEITSLNNAYVNTLSRSGRRNSSGDLATAQFYQYLEQPPLNTSAMTKGSNTSTSTSLKSVIKKKNYNENIEPKKVTFSAYATVQVVD